MELIVYKSIDLTLSAIRFAPIKVEITTPDKNYGLRKSITISTIEITATLELKWLSWDDYRDDDTWEVEKCYYGKSTYRVPAKQNPEEELTKQRAKMTDEAQKAAIIDCFRERLGFSEFGDIVFDELHRPLNV